MKRNYTLAYLKKKKKSPLQGQKALGFHRQCLNLCSEDEQRLLKYLKYPFKFWVKESLLKEHKYAAYIFVEKPSHQKQTCVSKCFLVRQLTMEQS